MNIASLKRRIADLDLQALTDAALPFLTEQRIHRIETVLQARLQSVRVALESPYDPHNASAVIRSCDAFGVVNVDIIAADNPAVSNQSVTTGAHEWLWVEYPNTLDAWVRQLKSQSVIIAGAVVDGDSSLAEVPVDKPLCLLLGNENRGLSPQARAHCDVLYRIPMLGMTESFNLSVSAAISMYDVCQRRRETIAASGDFTGRDYELLRACYYLGSIQPRLLQQLLNAHETAH